MFRLSAVERFALAKVVERLPPGAVAYLHGSRLKLELRGGDVDLVILHQATNTERFELSVKLTLEFQKFCDEKIDICVLPFEGRTDDEELFLSSLEMQELDAVLDTPRLDHVALLVTDLGATLSHLDGLGFAMSQVQTFPTEGTQEVYIGEPGRPGRLLLMQVIGAGPYQKAFQKRGPGLHHLGVAVRSMRAMQNCAGEEGWIEHAISAGKKAVESRWYFKNGTSTLIETEETGFALVRPMQAVVEHIVVRSTQSVGYGERFLLGMPEVTLGEGTKLKVAGKWMDIESIV